MRLNKVRAINHPRSLFNNKFLKGVVLDLDVNSTSLMVYLALSDPKEVGRATSRH